MAFKMNIPLPGGIEHADGYVRVTDCRVCKKDDETDWFMMVDVNKIFSRRIIYVWFKKRMGA